MLKNNMKNNMYALLFLSLLFSCNGLGNNKNMFSNGCDDVNGYFEEADRCLNVINRRIAKKMGDLKYSISKEELELRYSCNNFYKKMYMNKMDKACKEANASFIVKMENVKKHLEKVREKKKIIEKDLKIKKKIYKKKSKELKEEILKFEHISRGLIKYVNEEDIHEDLQDFKKLIKEKKKIKEEKNKLKKEEKILKKEEEKLENKIYRLNLKIEKNKKYCKYKQNKFVNDVYEVFKQKLDGCRSVAAA